ncbi:MAG: glycosyltransferase family 2 protein [Paludibacterium sp.]|uniref:glycosyltransferase family 2 protein n=1 Tax=Paludibacterium sp. TaxID=1917523 RepID=UPI0025D127EC|nr:glycosyltransferase family 2 protein [Paludibacterium sp.]MBV8045720.1 glycosyltransferase family 2 protein [Paludibacterium sp.]MBV8467914.1 glycosyltransferase family 2 protein [Burkholderiales bacterium]
MIDVSVIIPTFNRRQDLPIALDSVLGQPGVNVECIVVDDRSSDGTVEYIRERYKNHPLTVIEKPRRSGPQSSRNLGMNAAQGEFVTFLDSDDYFEPDTLRKRVQHCRDGGLDALFSGYCVKFVGRRWDLVKNVRTEARNCPADYAAALRDFKIAPMITIMYRRSAHENLKLDESLASGHDDDLALHLIRSCRFAFDDIPSATIIQHVGERVATPRNLMIGDAQLLKKYAADIAMAHGVRYLTRRRAQALAGLWSAGQFDRSALLAPERPGEGSLAAAFALGAAYLPGRMLRMLRKRLLMAAVRAAL